MAWGRVAAGAAARPPAEVMVSLAFCCDVLRDFPHDHRGIDSESSRQAQPRSVRAENTGGSGSLGLAAPRDGATTASGLGQTA